jgi:hypothetical protein
MAKLPKKTTVARAIQDFFGCNRREILALTRRERLDLARAAAEVRGELLKDADEYPVADPA